MRVGEGRTLAVMGGFLLLNTANTTVLSALKNGLFLSVYPAQLIPHAVIAGALLTAAVAIVFTGYVAATARRGLATGLTALLLASVLACRLLFALDPRSAFVVYLWVSAVQVLLLTHAWDYAGDLLTGRQAKRILPLIGVGASAGAILGGTGVAPAALALGTENLLWISAGLLVVALPLLWAIPEPVREAEEPSHHMGAAKAFLQRASRGVRSVASNELLRLLAVGLVALTLTGTLIDLQLKFLLQEAYSRDRITAIYGLLSAVVGAGTLLLQLWASRVLFPRFGVSFAAMLHGGLLALAAGGVAVFGGLAMLVAAQAIDDILQFSLQKPVEQVSLLPFPNRVKSVALATLGGVLRPMSKASGGGVALALGSRPDLLPHATVVSALVAAVTYTRHRRRYVAALEGALARHVVDFTSREHMPLVADAGALQAIDRALADADATVVVFATSLLEQLPNEDALPRLLRLLSHEAPEVRAEAARVFSLVDMPLDSASGTAIAGMLAVEDTPFVLAAVLDTLGTVGNGDAEAIVPFLNHDDADVRQAAIVALGRLGWPETEYRLRVLLASDDSEERAIGARAVGELRSIRLLDALEPALYDVQARPAALEAMAALGPGAVPMMMDMLDRRELPLPLRRSVVSTLATVGGLDARNALVSLVEEPALGPAALTSLDRMRSAGLIEAIDPKKMHASLEAEMRKGLRYAAAATAIRDASAEPRELFAAGELRGLQQRSVERVLKILGLSYDTNRLNAISDGIRSESAAQRSNALELLEGTMSRTTGTTVMPFLEAVAEGLPRARLDELLDDPDRIRAQPAESLLNDDDWWPRAIGLHLLGRDDEVTTPGQSPDERSKDGQMIPLIEKVMILKGSEFFKNFPGADLAGIASLADVVHVEPAEVVFEQGDEGDAFYVVVRGAIKISRGQTLLATLGPREGFGEMAILDRDTRSATATASEGTTLLRLDRDSFDRVVEQNPVVARGIYRVLTERLRNTLAQVAAG
ncbi:MAG TPA: cyclic nucleotide-binding domain-containing protein [Longimicrobiales bacterium]|nr:cyclic nucleotide-binding domain-containing protein [Longimicrobiales bacterium]